MKAYIQICEHNPEWASMYSRELALLEQQLGDSFASIEHIGSTSISGMAAKPIIDIAIGINDYPPSEALISQFEALGYENKGEAGFEERYWLRKGNPRQYHIHIMQSDSEILQKLLIFRDALRDNESLIAEYAQFKLAQSKGKRLDDNEYAVSKNEFVRTVIEQFQAKSTSE